jgi:heme/copper-type cytochrome/quinol oxidase subunit 4
MARIEFGVIVATAATLFFPFMSQAFVQSAEALYGLAGRGTFSRVAPLLSLAFGAWTLLTVFFFYRRRDKEIEAIGKMGSAIAGILAVLQYTILTAVFVRVLGSGADSYSIIALLAACVVTVIITVCAPWDLIQVRWK